MTLTGLLTSTLTLETVIWNGPTPAYGPPVAVPARFEDDHSTVTSPDGDAIAATLTAYLPGDADISVAGHRATLPDGTHPVIAEILTRRGRDGTPHHLAARLAPPGPDTVTITRPGPPGHWDPLTGEVIEPASLLVYTGPAAVDFAAGSAPADTAGQLASVQTVAVRVTLHTDPILVGDLVTVDDAADPHLAGAVLRVSAASTGGFARRLDCERVLP